MRIEPFSLKGRIPLRVPVWLAIVLSGSAHQEVSLGSEASYFRVVSSVPTTLLAIGADGTITWSVAEPNVTCTVQKATTLLPPADWADYVQVWAFDFVFSQQIFDREPPANMVFIPAGSFDMGDSFHEGESNEIPVHSVHLSAFYLDRFEVTTALWQEVHRWALSHNYSFDNPGQGKASNHPVHSVNWYDAVKWCNARSEKEGRKPAYYTDESQVTIYRSGREDPLNDAVDWNAGYRLPTEAEWEKAARGGEGGLRFPWGNTISHAQANYGAALGNGGVTPYDLSFGQGYHPTYANGSEPFTNPVGAFPPNRYGLYDTRGNLWEWCWDRYGDYTHGPENDPRGPESDSMRMRRGGSWRNAAYRLRSSDRLADYADSSDIVIGFRCALPHP